MVREGGREGGGGGVEREGGWEGGWEGGKVGGWEERVGRLASERIAQLVREVVEDRREGARLRRAPRAASAHERIRLSDAAQPTAGAHAHFKARPAAAEKAGRLATVRQRCRVK